MLVKIQNGRASEVVVIEVRGDQALLGVCKLVCKLNVVPDSTNCDLDCDPKIALLKLVKDKGQSRSRRLKCLFAQSCV